MATILKPSQLLLLCFILVCSLSGTRSKKEKEFLEEVDDIKDLKKLLRTRTNVLVLFVNSEKSNSKIIKLFNEAAEELRGIATICLIDCSDAGKLCKKQKINPEPTVIQHFKDGEYNKDYDRAMALKSIVNFLKDPTGDMPWEEDATATDIVHITSVADFSKVVSKTKLPMLIMFYAPWCGHCKRLKPEFAQAATTLKGENVLVGVDVDKPEMSSLRVTFNITGFPTILYFVNGKVLFPYGGEMNKDGLIKWLRSPAPPAEPKEEEQWSDVVSDVVHLTSENFKAFINTTPSVLVMFYAPWCGHCKKMKPEYEEAAAQLKSDPIEGAALAAVDATKHRDLGEKFGVKGFPTVKYFQNGVLKWDFHQRTKDQIVEFMKDPQEPPAPPPPEAPWSEVESEVVHLEDSNFQQTIKKKKYALIMFYAPWCGHCKKAKPHFMAAAERFKDDAKVMFGAVDCTAFESTCKQYEVQGYPTLLYFNYGKNPQRYNGGREEDDFVSFMTDPLNPKPAPVIEQEEMWKDVNGAENIVHLTNRNFDQFIKSNPSVLVMFYAPWCGHCKRMKPDYAAAATVLRSQNIGGVLAAVDATLESATAEKYGVKGFPTLKYFKGGEYAYDFDERSEEKLLVFMKNPQQPRPAEPESLWSAVVGAENVHQLTAATFDSFMTEHPSTLVMFYAPWCGHCKNMKSAYAAAASRAASEKLPGSFAAVDCTVEKELAARFEVKGFPTLLYFKDGNKSFKYSQGRDTESLLSFIQSPTGEEANAKDEL